MKKHFSVLAAVASLALCAAPATSKASVLPTESGAGLLDTDTQLLWKIGDLTSGQVDGYRLATVADVSTMLANRLQDLTAHGATQVSLRDDGSYQLVGTPGSTFPSDGYTSGSTLALLQALGGSLPSSDYSPDAWTDRDASIYFREHDSYGARHVATRTAMVGLADGAGTTSVMFEMGEDGVYTSGHYSQMYCRVTCTPAIGSYWIPASIYWHGRLNGVNVKEAITIGTSSSVLSSTYAAYPYGSSMLNPSALDPVGYLMIKSAVPEVSTESMMLLGLMGIAAAKLGRSKRKPLAN